MKDITIEFTNGKYMTYENAIVYPHSFVGASQPHEIWVELVGDTTAIKKVIHHPIINVIRYWETEVKTK